MLCSVGMMARESLDTFGTAASDFSECVSSFLVKVGVESPGLLTLVTFPITLTKQLAEATSGRGGFFALRLWGGQPLTAGKQSCVPQHIYLVATAGL